MAPVLLFTTLLGAASAAAASFAPGFTIKARDDYSTKHLAEIAELDVEVSVCHPDRETAKQGASEYAHELRQRLQDIASVECDFEGVVSVSPREEQEDDWSPRRAVASKDQITMGDESKVSQFCGETDFPVTISDLEKLPELKRITTEGGSANATAKVQNWVNFKLSNTTRTLQKNELRKQAVAKSREIGYEYAATLGFDHNDVVFVGIEEGYCNEYEERRRNRWICRDDEEADLTVPEMETTMEFVLQFRLLQ